MTLPTVLASAGCLALFIAAFGGGIKAKEVVVPKISTWPRVMSGLIGLALIVTAIWLSSPDPFAHATFTAQNLDPDCRLSNLLNCSTPMSIFVDGQSRLSLVKISETLELDFDNQQNGSGVSLQFIPPLDVSGFNYVEIHGTSSQTFDFLVEYKVKAGDQVGNATTSTQQIFHASSTYQTVSVPIVYGKAIDELTINFPERGQSSVFTIESIRLK